MDPVVLNVVRLSVPGSHLQVGLSVFFTPGTMVGGYTDITATVSVSKKFRTQGQDMNTNNLIR